MYSRLKKGGIMVLLSLVALTPIYAQQWAWSLPDTVSEVFDVVVANDNSIWISARANTEAGAVFHLSETGDLLNDYSFPSNSRVAIAADSADGLFVAYSTLDGYDVVVDHINNQSEYVNGWLYPTTFAKDFRFGQLPPNKLVLYAHVEGVPQSFLQLIVFENSAPNSGFSVPVNITGDNKFRAFVPTSPTSFTLLGGDTDTVGGEPYYAAGIDLYEDNALYPALTWVSAYNDLGWAETQTFLGGSRQKQNGNFLFFAQNQLNIIGLEGQLEQAIPLGQSLIALHDDSDSSVVLVATSNSGNTTTQLLQFAENGSLLATQLVENILPSGLNQHQAGWLLYGKVAMGSDTIWQIRKIKNNLSSLKGQVKGHIFHDADINCLLDSNELGLAQRLIAALRPEDGLTLYSVSDSNGHYEMGLDTGYWQIFSQPINVYWGFCQDTQGVLIVENTDTIDINLAAQVDLFCTALKVDLGTPLLRRCFNNTYYLQYENGGTELAANAYIDVELDPFLSIVTASQPYEILADSQRIRFPLGDVAVGQAAQIEMVLYLNCDSTTLGQTHCVSAKIFPDSICIPDNPNWAGSKIEVRTECVGDTAVLFNVKNIGSANMLAARQLYIIEDLIIMMQVPFNLNKGDSLQILRPASGQTIRLKAQQELGYPENSFPTIAAEGCGAEDLADIHLGYVLPFPEDNIPVAYERLCMESIGSFDPNDKMGLPLGVGQDGFVEPGTAINYQIRFQNTGTDTAFNIEVRDTLSVNLDLSSMQLGASSHPYILSIEEDRILSFKFSNIMLPDSNINEPGSHGFFRFSIAPLANTPLGTQIENTAHIYFDFNAPVVTNTTRHTLAIDFLELVNSVEEKTAPSGINIYPQPSADCVTIAWEGTAQSDLRVYNTLGELMLFRSNETSPVKVCKNLLPAGFYHLVLVQNGVSRSTDFVLHP